MLYSFHFASPSHSHLHMFIFTPSAVAVVGMVGGIHEVDRGATLQEDEPEDLTRGHQGGIAPILDPGPVPRKCPGPVPDPSHHEGGLHLCQMMEISNEGVHCLGHHRGSDPSLLELAMEALGARGPLLLGMMTD